MKFIDKIIDIRKKNKNSDRNGCIFCKHYKNKCNGFEYMCGWYKEVKL